MTEAIRPREVIAKCHAERDQYGGEVADRILVELEAAGFAIIARAKAEEILEIAASTWRDAALAVIVTAVVIVAVALSFDGAPWPA